MQTHTKEALASMIAALALIGVIHAGIWFTIFGTPDFTVLGFPFHYFWLVAGGPIAMFVLYWIYYQYVTTSIMEEKQQLKQAAADAETTGEVGAEPGDSDD
ncbi:hypothetical protein GS429_00535 [Natronorubrum sp. JWXQ-INN-674]|uniref:DUF4212 domain-containing protein n=1 Tax=Natronorubrum halalkaliphilum TaxID=2691917 RepID=A0A6B0VIZ8_9EURY|nr:hypothetical protein [Natronorubrum halalkaliphilum]MXV60579.1 hypothetical protein [Natronorubrum halalkaliphilum]